ncbi:conserved Plasmodium protein, unknown function [Babesia microti strain RI]|uniref:Mcm6 C-terminal winged-helix domain-containing protein n=1 Tax=Babesia microti (strain RI) TaxID=1133968 RepID=A0A1R4AC12_BABMR|nr:conserved Plasmodium protein, unknown function [Babesia microti strain RI]SJK86552.1 conserved Plasmodium protein, unknown function [Babesia microti strain RI]|eukprot:XP_021338696.1 conserved Plasmodium protein, unknown function [Babesia microti strain RI]
MSCNVHVEYDSYVHFAVRISDYLTHVCSTKSSIDYKAVAWYLRNYRKCTNKENLPIEELEVIYRRLIENLIHDKCIDVVNSEGDKRIIKPNDDFMIWPWRRQVQYLEQSLNFSN